MALYGDVGRLRLDDSLVGRREDAEPARSRPPAATVIGRRLRSGNRGHLLLSLAHADRLFGAGPWTHGLNVAAVAFLWTWRGVAWRPQDRRGGKAGELRGSEKRKAPLS